MKTIKLYRNRFGVLCEWDALTALTALDVATYTEEERRALVAELRERVENPEPAEAS